MPAARPEHPGEDGVGRPARGAIIALAVASLGMAGCGADATDAVKSVRSEASAHARASVQGELDRAQARVDGLVREAEDRGVPAALLRAQADRALGLARAQAARAIARARESGRDPGQIARLEADARSRVDALGARIDSALGD